MRPKYKARKYLGLYEKEHLLLWGKHRFRRVVGILERFFDLHKEKIWLTDFLPEHMHDYSILRRSQGAANATVAWELSIIRQFWKWASEDKDLLVMEALVELYQKLAPPQRVYRKKKALNSLEELRAIYFHITSYPLREYILSSLRNDHPRLPKLRWFDKAWDDACAKAGLDYWLSDFIKSLGTLRLRVLEYFHPQLSDALALKTKLDSDTLGTVQIPPANIWPSIGDGDEYDPTVITIGQLQPGPKGHITVGHR